MTLSLEHRRRLPSGRHRTVDQPPVRVCHVWYLRSTGLQRQLRPQRAHRALDARHDGPSRTRRRGGVALAQRPRSARSSAPFDRGCFSLWAPTDVQRGRQRVGEPSTVRYTTTANCAPNWKRAVTPIARVATPRRSFTSTSRRASAAWSCSTACSRSRSGTSVAASCFSRATGWERSRCTGVERPRAWCSPRRSRRCCATRRSAPTWTSRRFATTSRSCARRRPRRCSPASRSSRRPSV